MGETVEKKIPIDGNERSFIIYSPIPESPAPLPVVFMLHGDGGTAENTAKSYDWIEKAEEEGFIAVFPEGRILDPAKKPNFVANPHSWSHDLQHNLVELEQNAVFLKEVLNFLQSHYRVDPQRIYFTGFSSGGMMAFYSAISLKGQIAAIAPVCGYMPLQAYSIVQSPIPILFIVGEADTLNPINGGSARKTPWQSKEMQKKPMADSLLPWLNAAGFTKDSFTVTQTDHVRIQQYGQPGSSKEIIYVVVKGQGHEWPGGKQLLPVALSGNNLPYFKATNEIWNFFKDKKLIQMKF